MSEHPPIPSDVLAMAWHEFRYPRPAIDEPTPAFERAMAIVARWLRGMAVVPLPEPDEELHWGTRFRETVGQCIVDSPEVIQHGMVMSPAGAREQAGRLLAAADRAEHLAAEAKMVTP